MSLGGFLFDNLALVDSSPSLRVDLDRQHMSNESYGWEEIHGHTFSHTSFIHISIVTKMVHFWLKKYFIGFQAYYVVYIVKVVHLFIVIVLT